MVRHLPSNPGIGHDRSAISHCLYFRASSIATHSLENAFTPAFVAANCKVVNAPARPLAQLRCCQIRSCRSRGECTAALPRHGEEGREGRPHTARHNGE